MLRFRFTVSGMLPIKRFVIAKATARVSVRGLGAADAGEWSAGNAFTHDPGGH
jgi:hypothetical protein